MKLKVLVIGQTPPPYGGQTIMTAALLEGDYRDAEIRHINSDFSTSLSEMARASTKKLVTLFIVLVKAVWEKARHRPKVLYYHPAGASKTAILRDIVLLTCLRPLFPITLFHVHARGLMSSFAELPGPLRRIASHAYATPEVLVGPSKVIVEEAAGLMASGSYVIPNGTVGGQVRERYVGDGPVRILFLNLISEPKGADWLLEEFAVLRDQGLEIRLTMVGEFKSESYRQDLLNKAARLGVRGSVSFPGPLVGYEKWRALEEADIFCLPTTWVQESFGLAIVEAASCGLPIVAADVPGVRELLEPGVSIRLIDPADRGALGRCLYELCTDPEARNNLGTAARRAFEQQYTLDQYWSAIGAIFTLIKAGRYAAS